MFRTCQKVHVLQAGGVLFLETREGCLELQLGDLTCHVPHYWAWEGVSGRDRRIRRRGRTRVGDLALSFFFFRPFSFHAAARRFTRRGLASRSDSEGDDNAAETWRRRDVQTHRPWRACDNLPSSVWNQLKSTNVEGDALRYARGGGRGGGGWWWCWVLVEDDRWSSWRPLVSALMSRIISLSQGRLHPRALVLHRASPLYLCLLIRCLLLSSAKMSAILSSVSYKILLVSRKIRAAVISRLSTWILSKKNWINYYSETHGNFCS